MGSKEDKLEVFFKSVFKPFAKVLGISDKSKSKSRRESSRVPPVEDRPRETRKEKPAAMGNACCTPPDQFPKQQGVVPRQVSRLTPTSNLQVTKTGVSVRDIYRIGRTLGTGGFSVVKLATHKETGDEYACKIMSLPPPGASNAAEVTREDIFKEINILISLDHPNIIYLREYFEEGNKAYLVMEYLGGGELLDAVLDIGHYSENEARIIFRQIVAGVGYLHSKGIAHRDLKLENLLMAKRGDIMGVKIADFGLAKGQAATSLSTICGTPQYVAPEVIAKGAKSGFHSYKLSCDVWSCGVILFVLLGGYPPFYDESEPRLFDKIRRGAYSFNDPVWEQISDSAKELIKRCLTLDPALRPTCEDILNDPWVMGNAVSPPKAQLLATKSHLRTSMRRQRGAGASNASEPAHQPPVAEESIIAQLAAEEREERHLQEESEERAADAARA
ncbi:hypothetical protein APUTEX25_005304 [Auxenochlorella protothecoides]|uniref:Protein kinase domain-containing protein n=3 Tax=Auxenochlorella protothecoides TaxID=3075 RepID=A0A3M7KUD7_AUXPR|nr:hypothetical protein APUTEX25_005304 [Auxenochlorella protothecoides]|eukprot:RMZ54148.1 hypothetical protein APUTEX25_005304 [Auxenochlorella protothecoides]